MQIHRIRLETLNNLWTVNHFLQILEITDSKFVFNEYWRYYWPLDYCRLRPDKPPMVPDRHYEKELSSEISAKIFAAFQPFTEGKYEDNCVTDSGIWILHLADTDGETSEYFGSYIKKPFVDTDINPTKVLRECLQTKYILGIDGNDENSIVLAEKQNQKETND